MTNSDGSFLILGESDWNGLSIADTVLSIFLFIVGISLVLSIGKMKEQGNSKFQIMKKAILRFLKLFFLGLFLNGARFPHYNLQTIRIMGPLQRIAIDYFIGVLVIVYIPPM